MYFLYNLLLIIIIILASPYWLFKVLTTEKHRRGFFEKVFPPGIKGGRGGIHVHAVSVGEVIAAVPFIRELKKRHPGARIVLSTVTPTGNEIACRRLPEVDDIVYSPFDLIWSVRRFLRKLRPDLCIIVETELWPNFLREAKRSGAAVVLINGRISPSTYKGYSRLRFFMKQVLAHVDALCMQTEEDAGRIREIGAPAANVHVTGSMKYDQKFIDINEGDLEKKRKEFGIGSDEKVIIAGSTHRGEDEVIIESYKTCLANFGNLRLIIVPRHVERADEIVKLVRSSGFEPVKRTELPSSNLLPPTSYPLPAVIIVDTIGELAALYCMAEIVIIGGSFIPHGGQNPLEALYYKKPVLFGQHMFNFREIVDEVIMSGAGIKVDAAATLAAELKDLLSSPEKQKEMGEKGYQIIVRNRGAVSRNLSIAEKFLRR